MRPETLAITAGRPDPHPGAPLNEPLVLAAPYHAGADPGYARSGNPTWARLEEAVGALEGGTAVAFASGMAAVAATLEGLPVGARVVAPRVAYMDVRTVLGDRTAAGRLDAVQVDITDTEATLAACVGADLVWLESPTNPLVGIADLAALTEGAHRAGAVVVVDSTLATPLLQRPLSLGADVVVHSATKFIGGHSDLLLGIAVCADAERATALHRVRAETGGVPGTLEAWLALRGLRTLPVRLVQGQASAMELARRLAAHPDVTDVRYPGLPGHPGHEVAVRQMDGFGAMLAFDVTGGAQRAEGLCEALRVLTHATSLGGVETLIERRARWAGEAHLSPSLLRVSVGCEHVEDLWADLEQALAATSPV